MAPPSPGLRTSGSGSIQEASLNRLYSSLVEALRAFPFEAPLSEESEPAYTTRVLVPGLRDLLGEPSGVGGVLIGGHHTGISRPVSLLGASFVPDLAMIWREERLVAVEVKYLQQDANRGAQLSKALGQALVYSSGYRRACALAIEVARTRRKGPRRIPTTDQAKGQPLLVYRRAGKQYLEPGLIIGPPYGSMTEVRS